MATKKLKPMTHPWKARPTVPQYILRHSPSVKARLQEDEIKGKKR